MLEQIRMLNVTIVTPFGTREVYTVRQLRAPGAEGDFGVLPGHTAFLTTLRIGEVILDSHNEATRYAISGGYLEVLNDQITILAETAERADLIDIIRAQESKRRALELLKRSSGRDDIESIRYGLLRAINRLKVAGGGH